MKKIIYILFIIVLMFSYSCTKNESPRPVAENFIKAFQQHDFETAAKYSTKETVKMLKQLQRIEELEKIKPAISKTKIEILTEEIAGNKATVFFKEQGSTIEEKIHLEKVPIEPGSNEREWKVALSKTDVKIPAPHNGSTVPDSIQKQVF